MYIFSLWKTLGQITLHFLYRWDYVTWSHLTHGTLPFACTLAHKNQFYQLILQSMRCRYHWVLHHNYWYQKKETHPLHSLPLLFLASERIARIQTSPQQTLTFNRIQSCPWTITPRNNIIWWPQSERGIYHLKTSLKMQHVPSDDIFKNCSENNGTIHIKPQKQQQQHNNNVRLVNIRYFGLFLI